MVHFMHKTEKKKIIILFANTSKEKHTWKIFIDGDRMQYVEIANKLVMSQKFESLRTIFKHKF